LGRIQGPVKYGQSNSASKPSYSSAKFIHKFNVTPQSMLVNVVSGILTEDVNPFSDGEIIKEFLEAVADVALADKKKTRPF
jgi:hypothetical protein